MTAQRHKVKKREPFRFSPAIKPATPKPDSGFMSAPGDLARVCAQSGMCTKVQSWRGHTDVRKSGGWGGDVRSLGDAL